jgi:hypothetical protein
MTTTNPFFPRHNHVFKGGTPDAPKPIPPVTQASTEVAQASLQAKRDAAKRSGYASTLLAGETGGEKAAVKTLLGS